MNHYIIDRDHSYYQLLTKWSGSQGENGIQGPQGPQGQRGADGVSSTPNTLGTQFASLQLTGGSSTPVKFQNISQTFTSLASQVLT